MSTSVAKRLGGLFPFACLLLFGVVFAQTPTPASEPYHWTIETVAGTGNAGYNGEDKVALQCDLNNPFGVLRDSAGNIWFCEYSGQRIRWIDQQGVVHTFAGTGETGYSGDHGPAIQATMNKPHEIRFDSNGDLFLVDMANHAVRRIDRVNHTISTVVGTGKSGYRGDGGPADQAQLNQPHSIQFGPDGRLYICDIGNHSIRVVDLKSNRIETFAGKGRSGATVDGARITDALLNGPRSLDFDHQGNLWLVTREGNQLFELRTTDSTIHHRAGTGAKGFVANNGKGLLITLNGPKGIALDREGNAWIVDTESHSIWRYVRSTETLEWIAGTGEKGDGSDGNARECALARPHGIFVDADGSVLIGDSESHKIRMIRRNKH